MASLAQAFKPEERGIRIERPGFRLYFSVVTRIPLSVVLTLMLWIISLFRHRLVVSGGFDTVIAPAKNSSGA